MAEISGLSKLLDMIVGAVTPSSAEAKVVGSPKAMQLLREAMEVDPTYKDIVQYADKIPAEVDVQEGPGLMSGFSRALGQYDPLTQRIHYDPSQNVPQAHQTLVHELLHFLNAQSKAPVNADAQHAIIREMLGTAGVPQSQLGLGPPKLTEEQRRTFDQWLGR